MSEAAAVRYRPSIRTDMWSGESRSPLSLRLCVFTQSVGLSYDNLFRAVAEVEIATMKTLANIGIIPSADIASLTHVVEQEFLAITRTEVEDVERFLTKHDHAGR